MQNDKYKVIETALDDLEFCLNSIYERFPQYCLYQILPSEYSAYVVLEKCIEDWEMHDLDK